MKENVKAIQTEIFFVDGCSPNTAALCINFFGIQPTLTQVPPRPETQINQSINPSIHQ
jgi:hypothetical protein